MSVPQIHTETAGKTMTRGKEELQTPHPACVKINPHQGGDLFVSLTIMEISVTTPHRFYSAKEFHCRVCVSGAEGSFL